jgi:hypothetical protein
MTNNNINYIQEETQRVSQYLEDSFNKLNLTFDTPDQYFRVMENWSPKQDPAYLDMGADEVTLYCYPNGKTYAVSGTQNHATCTYVVQGLQAALFLVQYFADDSISTW